MGYSDAYQKMWQNYARFDGRASLPEYWKPFLINLAVAIVFSIVDRAVAIFSIVYFLYILALILPALGLAIRRLHDAGHTGWWWLVGFIPILGWLFLIYLLAQPGTPGSNDYGLPPA